MLIQLLGNADSSKIAGRPSQVFRHMFRSPIDLRVVQRTNVQTSILLTSCTAAVPHHVTMAVAII
jgi:hypothetical protein